MEIFGSVSNITGAPLAYYQRIPERTFSRQIYTFNGDFGLSVRF